MCIFSQGNWFSGSMLIIDFGCDEYCRILHRKVCKFDISILHYFFRHCGGHTLWGPPLSHVFVTTPPFSVICPYWMEEKVMDVTPVIIILYHIQQTAMRDFLCWPWSKHVCWGCTGDKELLSALGPRVSSSQQPAKSCSPHTVLRKSILQQPKWGRRQILPQCWQMRTQLGWQTDWSLVRPWAESPS